jgi:hypothetical protein
MTLPRKQLVAVEDTPSHYADKLPDDGVAVFNKQLAQFKIILPAG